MIMVCVIAALGFLFLYRSLGDIGKIFFSAFLPTTGKKKVSRPQRVRTLAKSVNDTPTPWGWDSKATKANKATRSRPKAPYNGKPVGRTVNHDTTHVHGEAAGGIGGTLNHQAHDAKPERIVNPDVGWPYREEKVRLADKNDKVARKSAPKPKPTDLSKASKPWGW